MVATTETVDGSTRHCVLKFFKLDVCGDLKGFLREVALHEKLKHPLVVQLRHAFFDENGVRGVLHFDRYPCDMSKWWEVEAPKRGPC